MTAAAPAEDLAQLPPQANVAGYLRLRARAAPAQVAVAEPRRGGWERTSYAELDAFSDRLAAGFAARGLARGERACVFVPPGSDFLAVVHALFRVGAVPVLLDPGMGRARLLACIERSAPAAFIGTPKAHLLRLLDRRALRAVRLAVATGGAVPGAVSLGALARAGGPPPAPQEDPDADAAILFTSGATGPPKGALYTHRTFDAQVRALRALYDLRPGEVDLTCFPLFALFAPALQWTSVVPRMDFARPARCEPTELLAAARENRATTTFGSPAIWRRLVEWCRERGERLTPLRRVLIAGAPVPARLVVACRELLAEGGEVHTPYGATEALPVASAAGADLAGPLRARIDGGEGSCVGRPAPGVELRLVRITDEALPRWSDDLAVPEGEPGEVCVRGAMVTRAYAGDPEATRLAKIEAGDGSVWHRMGDVGRLDADGRLWFLGRKAHRLETARGLLMPVPVENVFDLHERIAKSALVGVGPRGQERPVLVVQLAPGALPKEPNKRKLVTNDILRVGLWVPICGRVEAVLYRDALPVDPRHNAKIDRTALREWAAGQLR